MNPDSSEFTEISAKNNKVHLNGSLSIFDVQKEDAGTYKVQISNSAGWANREIQVTVSQEVAPFFDPVPKSVKSYPGQDVFINTKAKGSTPINVSRYSSKVFMF